MRRRHFSFLFVCIIFICICSIVSTTLVCITSSAKSSNFGVVLIDSTLGNIDEIDLSMLHIDKSDYALQSVNSPQDLVNYYNFYHDLNYDIYVVINKDNHLLLNTLYILDNTTGKIEKI